MFSRLEARKKWKLAASLAACIVAGFMICSASSSTAFAEKTVTMEKTWAGATVEHKGFRDLGNYVIELPDFTDASVEQKGLAVFNSLADIGKMPAAFGCTSMAKRNSKGEVVIGRNMDLDISQSAAYVFRTTYGKYKTFGVAYAPGFYKTYEELKKMDALDENIRSGIPFMACDCMNEKGLYIEMNLRERCDKLTSYGMHSVRGEKTRSDGTPWSELRACQISAAQLAAQNCATVQEVVAFLKNSYDWYTVGPMTGVDTNNMCFLVGDATGEYGLIEMAQDQINYIPYQYGQANFYITPRWRSLETCGAGEGRLDMVSKVIGPVETLDEAMEAMKPIMWRNETLWIGESYRARDKAHPNPYSQIVFQDDEGNPQMDWRDEYVGLWPVMDDGRMLISAQMYDEAENSTYDPMIKKYFDEAIATGRLVIDDGSFTFDVNGEQVTLNELIENEAPEANADNPERKKAMAAEYRRLKQNEDVRWLNNDYNFEALKAAAYAKLHIRRDKDGTFNPSAMSQYEKLLAFYGYETEKDETPLRDDGTIWTTSLNVGVNCAKKEMKIRFWENDDVIYHVKF